MSGEAPFWQERLRVPWWWHGALVGLVVLFGTELTQIETTAWLQAATYAALLALGELFLWGAGRGRVLITGGTVEVGDWRLPLRQVRSVEALDGGAARAVLRRRDDRVYRYVRGWVHGVVRLEVDDPEDLPVWLFSSRDPGQFAGALIAARRAAVPDEVPDRPVPEPPRAGDGVSAAGGRDTITG